MHLQKKKQIPGGNDRKKNKGNCNNNCGARVRAVVIVVAGWIDYQMRMRWSGVR